MGFNIADAEPLDYNFGEYGDGDTHPIKEPTDKQVRKFFKRISQEAGRNQAELQATVARRPEETDADYETRLTRDQDKLADEQVTLSAASRRRTLEILSEVCSGDPSVEQLEKLPERGQTEFLRYIRTELVPKG